MKRKKRYKIGLVDADLLCNGTRHPNLALLKIAGYLRDNGFKRMEHGLGITSVRKIILFMLCCNG